MNQDATVGTIWTDFAVGILASITAAIIVFVLSAILSRTVRRVLTAAASALLGVEVRFVFPNGTEAQKAISVALQRSRVVRIFTGRGNEFQNNYYAALFDGDSDYPRSVQLLLPDTFHQPRGQDWINVREQELAPIDRAFGDGVLKRQISTNYHFLAKFIREGHFEIRAYDFPHMARIILTDNDLFITPYIANRHGRTSPVIHYGRGDTFDMFSHLFDLLWSDARPVSPELITK